MIRKEKICSSQTQAAGSLFYTKRCRVSRIWAITDMDTGEEKRTGELSSYIMVWGRFDSISYFCPLGADFYVAGFTVVQAINKCINCFNFYVQIKPH